ncbi:hypothetical protein ACTVZO_10745 [Streptomyces sp. IBSNAI002]|uniref:hypothetical protein n=1 Tax=Streptomyces sp. IBSNAI002 TaxID=3457500 RepID=UPI003FD5BC4A
MSTRAVHETHTHETHKTHGMYATYEMYAAHGTYTTHEAYATPPSAPGLGTGRRIVRVVALAATVPYLALNGAWLAGSRIGIPAGSVLNEPGLFFTVTNSVTLAVDACVILLVLVLTRPWGIRVPSWLLTVPVFFATGLLTPILLGFTGQLLIRLLGFGAAPDAAGGPEPFLEPWVFNVVYTGFTVQGIALAGLFVPYARERWGRGRPGGPGGPVSPDGARGSAPSSTGVAAASVAAGLAVAAAHAYWAFGGTAWLSAEQAASYTAEAGVAPAVHAICALAAGAGAVLLARGGRAPARWPRWALGAAWTGSGATLSWGTWMLVASLGPQLDGGRRPRRSGPVGLRWADDHRTALGRRPHTVPHGPPGHVNRLFGARARLRWVHQILGGALLMPYFLLAQVGVGVAAGGVNALSSFPLALAAYGAALPLAAVTAVYGLVRPLSVAAVRSMCAVPGERLAEGPARSWAARGRTSAWWTLHLGAGALVSGMILAVPPMAVVLIALPFSSGLWESGLGLGWFSTGAGPYVAPLLGTGLLIGLALCAAGAGALARLRRPYCSARLRRTGWPPPRRGPPTWRCGAGWPGSCTTRSGTP